MASAPTRLSVGELAQHAGPARGERDSGNATGVCCSSARAQRPEARRGRACPTKRAVWKEESDWRGVARTAPSPGQRRPCPAQALASLIIPPGLSPPPSQQPCSLQPQGPRQPQPRLSLPCLKPSRPVHGRPGPGPAHTRCDSCHLGRWRTRCPAYHMASGSSDRQSLFILRDSSQEPPPPGSHPSTPSTFPAPLGRASPLWVLQYLLFVAVTFA